MALGRQRSRVTECQGHAKLGVSELERDEDSSLKPTRGLYLIARVDSEVVAIVSSGTMDKSG